MMREWSMLIQSPTMAGVELFSARFVAHTYGRHAHESMAIGFVESGIGEFWCRGRTHRVSAGHLVLIEPGEPHTGGVIARRRQIKPAEPLLYHMLYIGVDLVTKLVEADASHIRFAHAAPFEPELARHIGAVHNALASSQAELAGEMALLALLRNLAAPERAPMVSEAPRPREHVRMSRVREFLDANATRAVSLDDLAAIAGVHPAYLVRAFHSATGFPPHAYQLQKRLEVAKELLASGSSVAAAAIDAGFYDQSHMTRHFRRAFGVSPGRYRGGRPQPN